MNVHLLRHLADAVLHSGPLWSQSMFAFEQSNGDLVSSVQARSNVLHQISEKYILRAKIPPEIKSVDNLNLCGAVIFKPNTKEKDLFAKYGIDPIERITFFRSIKIYGEMYTSLIYRKTKSIDYFAVFADKQMGKIKYYIKFNNSIYVLVELFDVLKENDHLQEVTSKQSITLFKIGEVRAKLLYMEIGSRQIVCSIPNKYEKT